MNERFERFIVRGFGYRVLSFGENAARCYGELMARRTRFGRPMSVPAGPIGAIALEHGFAVATGNTRDFEHSGLEIINPFAPGSDTLGGTP